MQKLQNYCNLNKQKIMSTENATTISINIYHFVARQISTCKSPQLMVNESFEFTKLDTASVFSLQMFYLFENMLKIYVTWDRAVHLEPRQSRNGDKQTFSQPLSVKIGQRRWLQMHCPDLRCYLGRSIDSVRMQTQHLPFNCFIFSHFLLDWFIDFE